MTKKQNTAITKLVNEWIKEEPDICKDSYDVGDPSVFIGLFTWLLTSNRIKGV